MVYGGLQSGKNGNLLFFLKKYIKKFLYCFGYILKLVYLLIDAIVLDFVEEGMIFCFSDITKFYMVAFVRTMITKSVNKLILFLFVICVIGIVWITNPSDYFSFI